MAKTFSASASMGAGTCLSYFYGRTGPTSGYGARQGASDSSSAERSCVGVLIFGGMAEAVRGGRVKRVTLTITCSARGSTAQKALSLHGSNLDARVDSAQGSAYVGAALGTLEDAFHGNTSVHVLDEMHNAGLFANLAAYLREGHDILTIYNGERGSGSGSTANYLEITAISIAVEYGGGTVHMRRNGEWVECAAYVRRGGEWVECAPHVRRNGEWTEI